VSVIYQHLEKPPLPPRELNPSIPDDVEAIILKALEKEPDRRFASAEEMAGALNTSLGRKWTTATYPAMSTSSTQPGRYAVRPSQRNRAPQRKRLLPWWVYVAVILVIAAFLAVVWVYSPRESVRIPRATVLAGQTAAEADSVPSADEIARAQARLGEHGFIAYITCNQTSEYYATQAREMGDLAAGYGLPYRIYDGNNDIYSQIPLIERARADGVTGLLVCPLNMSLLDESLRSIQSASMPLVMMQSGIPSYGGVLIAGDDYLMGLQAGRLAGQIITQEMGGKADVIILDYPAMPILITRANGLEEGIKQSAPNAHIIGRYMGATREYGLASVSDLLSQGVHFDVIASINDAGSFGAITAMEHAHIPPDKVALVSVDDEALAQQYIRQQYYMRGSVEVGREDLSRTAINAMVKLLAGATVPETYLVPPLGVVTRDQLELTATATPGDEATVSVTESPPQ
jgi:ribose transport system substrate-binding protein